MPSALVPKLAKAANATAVFWSRRYGAAEREIDTAVKSALRDAGIAAKSLQRSSAGRAVGDQDQGRRAVQGVHAVLARRAAPWAIHRRRSANPKRISAAEPPASLRPIKLESLGFLPTKPDWAGGLRATWTPGEGGARKQLSLFIAKRLSGYAAGRDRPDLSVTSGLSPHLRFGEISPRQVWHAVARAAEDGTAPHGDVEKFLSELGWREFSYHLLFHNPDLATANFDDRFDAFPWAKDTKALRAWQRGRTGYPIVDAGLRELWHTGVMHNRVRMIAASFLIKHLLIDWRQGEQWFWDTLVDADPANNAASWQWVAGSGADAAPYFRIFNPVLQGAKFDPEGTYVRRWVPELAKLSTQAHPPALGRASRRAGSRRHNHRPRLPASDRCPRRGPRAGVGRLRQDQALTR